MRKRKIQRKIQRKILGISLLELMLSLAIIAILLVMATRYYSTVRSQEQVNEAIKMVEQSLGAVDNWYWTYKDFSANGGISVQALINQGLLPKDFGTSPWNTTFSINSNSSTSATITLEQFNAGDCLNLSAILCNKQNIQSTCMPVTPGISSLNINYPLVPCNTTP